MSLPTLPSDNEKENKSGGKDKPQLSMPSLPDLDDLAPLDDLPDEEQENKDEIIEEKNLSDDRDSEADLDDEDFEELYDEEIEDEDNADFEEDEDDWEDSDEEEYEDFDSSEDDDDDWEEEGEEFSFLPTVEPDEEEDWDDEEEDEDVEHDKVEKPKKGSNFKELDDESVKEFFNNIKSKMLGFLPKKDKKNNKINNKQREKGQEQKPAQKEKKGKIGKKSKISPKIIKPLLIFLAVFGIVALIFFFISNGYKPIEELSTEVSSDNTEVTLQNFKYEEGLIKFEAVNNGDISADFFMEAEFTEKSLNPFGGDEYSCRSDIIAIESGGSVNEILRCENFDKDLEYKTDIEIIEIK